MNDNPFSTPPGRFNIELNGLPDRWRYWIILNSVLTLIAGLFILYRPDTLYQTIAYLIGIGIGITGLYKLIPSRNNPAWRNRNLADLLWGGICLAAAVLIFLNPDSIKSLIFVVWGIASFGFAFIMFTIARRMPRVGFRRTLTVLGVLAAVSAFLAFAYPEVLGDFLGRGAGAILTLIGAGGIYLTIRLGKENQAY